MGINDFKEPIPFMGRVKNRKCSNRKEKTTSKNKRKMIKASKKKNRKR